jgi:Ca2+-binding RTX toxin-like protein
LQELLTNTLLLFIQFKWIAITKSVFVIFVSLILLITTAQPNFVLVLADNDDDNDKPSTFQLGDLRMCTIQEKNIQGHTIIGTLFADICQGTDHSETILGLQDNDVLIGNGGDDIVMGGEGHDKIFGNAGDDVLQGDIGDDKIDGGGRNDALVGGDGDDILSGEDGNDKLYGVIGNDIMRGGPGANEFICGDGVDTVLDYNPAKGDIISNDCEIVNTVS